MDVSSLSSGLVCLPFGALLFLTVACYRRCAPGSARWRRAVLCAALVWSSALVVLTEVLSLARGLTPVGVGTGWGMVIVAAWLWGWRWPERTASEGSGDACGNPVADGPACGSRRARLGWIALLVALVVPSGVVALLAPPNNGDGYTYHMSRVMHWQQNASVAHYPTHIVRQLQLGPGAEFGVLHLQILSGGDRFTNLVQWLAMAGSVVAATLIARRLGAGWRGELMAGILVATLPMGILQSSSTQNDYVLSFFLMVMVYEVLVWRERPDWRPAIGAGVALGLAVLTKALAAVYAPGMLLCLLGPAWRSLGRHWRHVSVAVLVAVVVTAGFFLRNLALFGSPLGPLDFGSPGVPVLTNELHSPAAVASNLVRNTVLHLSVNFNPRLNPPLTQAVRALHTWLGLSIMDQRTTWGGFMVVGFSWMRWNENTAGNPVHLILIAGAFLVLWIRGRRSSWRSAAQLALGIALGYLLFCAIFKVQHYNSRFHLPLFVLAAACVGRVLDGSRTWCLVALAAGLAALAVPVHLYNRLSPLAGAGSVLVQPRQALYCQNMPKIGPATKALAEHLRARGARRIGYLCGWDDPEYLYWVYLRRVGPGTFRLVHVAVDNVSGELGRRDPFRSFRPDVVLSTRARGEREIVVRGQRYVVDRTFPFARVFGPAH